MASDEASEESEVLSALNASLESFVHKTLKYEQIECFHRILCYGRYILAVLPTEFGKSAIYQLIPKVLFQWAVQPTPHQKPPLFFVGLQRGTLLLPIDRLDAQR